MSQSFFTMTDSELYARSATFSAKINADPESYGLTEERCLAYAELNARYAEAYRLAIAPATRTAGTVISKNDLRAELRAAAADLAKTINGTPSVTDSERIALGLNVRAQRSPLAPPGTPYSFRMELLTLGWVRLSWKCDSPRRGAGVIYMISRQIGSGQPFTFVGKSGRRKFIDASIPAGSPSVTYRVQAVRSTSAGDVADHTVSFGVTGRGGALEPNDMTGTNVRRAA
jgi:hypothetical protein